MDNNNLNQVIESILFISNKPIKTNELADFLKVDIDEVRKIIDNLKNEYIMNNHGFRIIEIDEGVRLSTAPEMSQYIKDFFKLETKQNPITQAAYEVLSIIALNGPITRQEIEKIRGVSSENIIRSLLERNLIKESGRLDTIGKPLLYDVTELFYQSFGISNKDELLKLFEEDAHK
ncbi:SMC-Scp complex subunit ScpB [Caldicellulosiruptoraceae bacterium PP1]